MDDKIIDSRLLEDIVVIRKVPMNAKGCDMLRAIREYQVAEIQRQEGVLVDVPFPTSYHLMMADYCLMKGISI